MIPPIPYISPGPDYGMDTKYRGRSLKTWNVTLCRPSHFFLAFKQAGAGIYGMVSVFPLESGFCVADAEAIKVWRHLTYLGVQHELCVAYGIWTQCIQKAHWRLWDTSNFWQSPFGCRGGGVEEAEENLCSSLFRCKSVGDSGLMRFNARLFELAEEQPASVDNNDRLCGENYWYVAYRRGCSYPWCL